MTPLHSSSRPHQPSGRPCWLANPLVVVPWPQLEVTPEGALSVWVTVPSEAPMAFHQIEARVDPKWLPELVKDWWQGPEEALKKWWRYGGALSWSGAARPAEPILASANPEDLGL